MEECLLFILWSACHVAGVFVCIGFLAALGAAAQGLVRLAMKIPGSVGRRLRDCERREPDVPAAFVLLCLFLGLMASLWTGLLGRLLHFVGVIR